MNIIFLDIDGVLNCQVFYDRVGWEGVERERNICTHRIEMLNYLCKVTNAKVVVSSTWRVGRSIDELQKMFEESGGTFEVIGKTPVLNYSSSVRGNEIHQWLQLSTYELFGVHAHDFTSYVIIDDDDDMLLSQGKYLFQTDEYSGLTPRICDRIRKFFTGKTFQ